MAIKKSELYASLWKSCDELRGGMDASQYKDYVLVLLFMKYVSDKAASQRDYLLDVPEGARFADMVALKGKPEIGEGINKIVGRMALANESLRGAIDVADFNDPEKLGKGKDMVDRLSNLVAIFENPALDFRGNGAEGDDLLGDAYEYLMRHFATESGKSKGQFYTPAEVSRVMAQVVGVTKASSASQSIYDPTCGSGSLLLKAYDAAKSATAFDLAIYGQEMDNATSALARMNMVLHDAPWAEIWQDNTLASPHFKDLKTGRLKTFDFVVANPPFSTKSWSNGFNPSEDEYGRFPYVLPPKKNGDYAFLLHMISSLKSTGKAAVILPHGVLFRGNNEAIIRREIVSRGYVKGIIGLPGNLFYGTGIAACVVVIDKDGAAKRESVFMVDASRGFRKDGAKNRLREQDVHRIVDTFNRSVEVDRYSRLVTLTEIAENDFNLNLPLYIDSSEPADIHDLDGHLRGGIPERDIHAQHRFWEALPGLRDRLFAPASREGYSMLRIPNDSVRATIIDDPRYLELRQRMRATFDSWRASWDQPLRRLDIGARPKDVIRDLGESILDCFRHSQLLDRYGIYQRLMDYWDAILQDDLYTIAGVGWIEGARPRAVIDKKARDGADFVLGKDAYKSDLIPSELVVARHYVNERDEIERLTGALLDLEQQLTELAEEHGVEDGLLEEVVDDNGKLTRRAVVARQKELNTESEADGERDSLKAALDLIDAQAKNKARVKVLNAELQKKIALRYAELTLRDVQTLVVEDKWFAFMRAAVEDETDRAARSLAVRTTELANRYGMTLGEARAEANAADSAVDADLRRMGAQWATD